MCMRLQWDESPGTALGGDAAHSPSCCRHTAPSHCTASPSRLSESIPEKKIPSLEETQPFEKATSEKPWEDENYQNSAIARSGVELGGSTGMMVMWLGAYPAAPRCPSREADPVLLQQAGT